MDPPQTRGFRVQHVSIPPRVTPFPLRVDPETAVAHPAWQRARAAALDVLGAGGRAVLLGPPGSGKSLLLQELARALREAGVPVCLVGRADALGGVVGREAVLVDEADACGDEALAVLRASAGPMVLAGLPGFAAQLPQGADVRQIVLDRLSPEDVARFVVARLAAAGRPGLLEPGAVLALAQASQGLLRLVNTIGAAAVFLAELEGSDFVTRRHVEEAAAMREEVPVAVVKPGQPMRVRSDRGPALRRRATLVGAVALAGGAALSWVLARPRGGAAPVGIQAPVRVRAAAPTQLAMDDVAEASPIDGVAAESGEAGRTPMVADRPVLFRGPIFNETMGQGGRVALAIGRRTGDAITARFEASQGLVGSGVLSGTLSGAGRISASGQLLMGRTPFLCDLAGMMNGDTLVGSANFVRPGTGAVYHSRFSLIRA